MVYVANYILLWILGVGISSVQVNPNQNPQVAEAHRVLLVFSGFLGSYLALKNASFGDTSLDATYAAYTYQASCGVVGKCARRGFLASLTRTCLCRVSACSLHGPMVQRRTQICYGCCHNHIWDFPLWLDRC